LKFYRTLQLICSSRELCGKPIFSEKQFNQAWGSAEIFPGKGKVDILLIFFRLLAMQCRWAYTKKCLRLRQRLHTCFPCKKLHTEQMFVLVSKDILRLELA